MALWPRAPPRAAAAAAAARTRLVLALLALYLVLVLRQAAQHRAAAQLGFVQGVTHRGAQHVGVARARLVQAVVEPIIAGGLVFVGEHLLAAGLPEGRLPLRVLQAADDARVAVRHVLAKGIDLFRTGGLHGVLKVDVLAEADLLVEQRGAAGGGQAVALRLQAADDARRALRLLFVLQELKKGGMRSEHSE